MGGTLIGYARCSTAARDLTAQQAALRTLGVKDERTASLAPTVREANVTDPDSRIMKTKDGWVQGYNAQRSHQHQIVLACETPRGATAYAQRSCLIELVFGDRKHNRSMRGSVAAGCLADAERSP